MHDAIAHLRLCHCGHLTFICMLVSCLSCQRRWPILAASIRASHSHGVDCNIMCTNKKACSQNCAFGRDAHAWSIFGANSKPSINWWNSLGSKPRILRCRCTPCQPPAGSILRSASETALEFGATENWMNRATELQTLTPTSRPTIMLNATLVVEHHARRAQFNQECASYIYDTRILGKFRRNPLVIAVLSSIINSNLSGHMWMNFFFVIDANLRDDKTPTTTTTKTLPGSRFIFAPRSPS